MGKKRERRPTRAEERATQKAIDQMYSSSGLSRSRPARKTPASGPVRTEYYINKDGYYDVKPANHRNRADVQKQLESLNEARQKSLAKKFYSEYWIHDMEKLSPKDRELYESLGYEKDEDIF